jgi:predicted nucleic acid-binding protein
VRGSEEILLSTIVIGEPLYGFRNGSRLERNLQELEALLSSP